MRILSFTAGLTHLYNQSILQKALPEFTFVSLLGQELAHLRSLEIVRQLDLNIELHDNQWPKDEWWQPKPVALFLSTAYPSPFRCRLFRAALQHSIPVYAIEEVNQMANHMGESTHYFLPVDRLGVVSSFEARCFSELGYRPEQLVYTGWPFFSTNKTVLASDRETLLRSELGVEAGERVALLILGFLKERSIESFETLRVREQMLNFLSKGLPQGVRLVVKPHPAEDIRYVEKTVRHFAPGARVMESKIPIEDALSISDVVVSRGNSQVMFEAISRDLPLVIVPLGLRTLFDDVMPEVVAETPEQLQRICSDALIKLPDYKKVTDIHVPLSPEKSLAQTKHFFRSAQDPSSLLPQWSKRLDLTLQMHFVGMVEEAGRELELLCEESEMPAEYQPVPVLLHFLFAMEAEVKHIEELLGIIGSHKIRRWHIQALWLRQLHRALPSSALVRDGLHLVRGFNGEVNPHYFIHELLLRIDLESATGSDIEAEKLRAWFRRDYYFLPDFQDRELGQLLRRGHINKETLLLAGAWSYRQGRRITAGVWRRLKPSRVA